MRNTNYVYGVVVYAGHDTKAIKNSKKPPVKMSNLLKKMNKIMNSLFVFQASVCISFAAGSLDWQENHAANHTYLRLVN